MYSRRPTFIVGFHGCDETVRDQIVSHKADMKPSNNEYDWLGTGFYFWENDYDRALSFAEEQKRRGKIENPSVLGAYIDLGYCLDLLNCKDLRKLKDTYWKVKQLWEMLDKPLPENKAFPDSFPDILIRNLDCLIINTFAVESMQEIDSVRGVFWEGDDLYPGAGMKEKNHIQICIRNINCIKCFFIPRIKV